MKYIKDRFYNSRKRNPSLGAQPKISSHVKSELLFLRVVSAKVQQVFETTKYSEKFFLRASSELETSLRNSKATERRNPQSYPSYISLETVSDTSDQSDRQARSETPFFWVANAKVQQLFESTKYSEKFFSRASPVRLTPIIYSVISARICGLNKRDLQAML